MFKQILRRCLAPLLVVSTTVMIAVTVGPVRAQQPLSGSPLNFKVDKANQRMEMTVNTSRRLTHEKKIPEAQVNNPDILDLTPLSPNEIQVSAKDTGVTQINLWDEDRNIYTIDVIVYADVQELDLKLKSLFPTSSLKVIPVGDGVMITGFVDQPEHVNLIMRVAEEYYPKIINAMSVSGVRQVLLHVKVMEVSRTKLRALGFDFTKFNGTNVVHSGISGLIGLATPETDGGVVTYAQSYAGNPTLKFNVFDGGNAFLGVLEALREDKLAKILAEPTIVAVSGRPAQFLSGGEVGYQLTGGITGPTSEFKSFGTKLDFVAIVLGNGRVRLEVRSEVSKVDWSLGTSEVPGFRTRFADTGVELQAGQTLAIAGLVENRTDSINRGLPWMSEVPYLGMLFRRVREENNEIELIIMVTPELVNAMDADEVPPCGPGGRTTSPSDFELFFKGHLEVPNCCPGCGGSGCPQCEGNGGGSEPSAAPGEEIIIKQVDRIAGSQPVPGKQPAPSDRRDSKAGAADVKPSFIGPVGYDVVK